MKILLFGDKFHLISDPTRDDRLFIKGLDRKQSIPIPLHRYVVIHRKLLYLLFTWPIADSGMLYKWREDHSCNGGKKQRHFFFHPSHHDHNFIDIGYKVNPHHGDSGSEISYTPHTDLFTYTHTSPISQQHGFYHPSRRRIDDPFPSNHHLRCSVPPIQPNSVCQARYSWPYHWATCICYATT